MLAVPNDALSARPSNITPSSINSMLAAAGCVTDATLACLRADIDDTDAASAAVTLQQHTLSELTSEVLAVRADALAHAHVLESQVKLALHQDRRSVPMRSARADLLASCGAQAPSPIRDVEALQASLGQQRAAILQLDAATKNIVERATETLTELRQIEHLSKVLANVRATDPAKMLARDATDQLLKCCDARNASAMVPPPLREELLRLLCERAARDAAPTLPTDKLPALVALLEHTCPLGLPTHSVPEALVVRVLLANVLIAGAAEQREATLRLVRLQGASWDAAAAALCPRVAHLGMSDGLPEPAREELLELLARRAPIGSALSLAIARTRLSTLRPCQHWGDFYDADAHIASTISFAFRTAAASSESQVEATVDMVLQLADCSTAQVDASGPGWGVEPPAGTTGSAEAVRAAASSFVARFVTRLGGRLGLIFNAARCELARHPAQRLRLFEHLDGVGVKLADAVLAQVDASAQGNDMQRSVLKSHCRCSCPSEKWPQACKVCAGPTWSLIWQFARLQALTAAVGGAEGRVRMLAENLYMGWSKPAP